MKIDAIRERYMKDNLSVRLGCIAANLARVSSFVNNTKNRYAVHSILEESKYLIEWVVPESPLRVQAFLAEIQPILSLWQSFILKEEKYIGVKDKLRKKADIWSSDILRLSGLLK